MINTKFYGLSLIALLLLSACSSNDETIFEGDLVVENLSTTLTKRPESNSLLGQISITGGNNIGASFELLNESIENAFLIDQETGEIYVKDASLFNINLVSSLTAEVEVTAGGSVAVADVAVRLKISEEVISYFKDVALGFENGGASEITRKWGSQMKIYVDGDVNSTLMAKLQRSINDINNLATDGFSVSLVNSEGQSNTYFYFGTKEAFESLFPSASVGSNWGLFNVWWNNNVINRARIFVDAQRPSISQQESLILEELTQALGLGKDSPKYPGSIFYETATNGGFATEYSDLDRELVRLLYHPDMTIGLGAVQAELVITNILKKEW